MKFKLKDRISILIRALFCKNVILIDTYKLTVGMRTEAVLYTSQPHKEIIMTLESLIDSVKKHKEEKVEK